MGYVHLGMLGIWLGHIVWEPLGTLPGSVALWIGAPFLAIQADALALFLSWVPEPSKFQLKNGSRTPKVMVGDLPFWVV